MFTVWTLSARFALGVKSNDSRRGVPDAACISGASLNAGVNPGGEREAAFSSVARRIPRRLRPRKSFEPVQRAGPRRDKAPRARRRAAPETRLGATLVGTMHRALATLREQEITALTLVLALLGFTLLTIVVVFRIRRSADRAEIDARDEVASLRADVDRLKALLLSEPQVLVTWPAASEYPAIIGDTAMLVPGATRERVLAFGTWLEASAAQRMEQAGDTLHRDGRRFAVTVNSRTAPPSGSLRCLRRAAPAPPSKPKDASLLAAPSSDCETSAESSRSCWILPRVTTRCWAISKLCDRFSIRCRRRSGLAMRPDG